MVEITSFRNSIGINSYSKPNIEDLARFREQLFKSAEATNFLKIQKNLSDETIKRFLLGYDYYRNLISIPESKNGECVNVAYRSLEKEEREKYKKEKGCENWIFNESGLDIAKEKGGILIVSNQFDAMSAWQAGFKNVVSVPVGKNATGQWMELFDNIPKVYIAFENTRISKRYAMEFAERIGIDKCYEVILPDEVLDINAYFKQYDGEQFKDLVRKSKPYYTYKFKGLSDVVDLIKEKNDNVLKINCIPFIEFEEDWMVILSGQSNVGKTSHILNVASELSEKYIPTLILPFERGIKTVGKRFLQVKLSKTQSELNNISYQEWDTITPTIADLPIYFSTPNREEIRDIVARSKKLFNIKVILVDHLDYLVRKSTENHNVETSNTLQEFKSLAQEFNIIFIIVHHIKKQEGLGTTPKKPRMEDLKGSSSIYQDPEAVIMLSSPDKGQIEIDIVKNKGQMGSKIFEFNSETGVVGRDITCIPELLNENTKTQRALDEF